MVRVRRAVKKGGGVQIKKWVQKKGVARSKHTPPCVRHCLANTASIYNVCTLLSPKPVRGRPAKGVCNIDINATLKLKRISKVREMSIYHQTPQHASMIDMCICHETVCVVQKRYANYTVHTIIYNVVKGFACTANPQKTCQYTVDITPCPIKYRDMFVDVTYTRLTCWISTSPYGHVTLTLNTI